MLLINMCKAQSPIHVQFQPCDCSTHGLAMELLSVCPSVRLSFKRVHYDKMTLVSVSIFNVIRQSNAFRFLSSNFMVLSYRGSPRTSMLKAGTESANLTNLHNLETVRDTT